MSAVVVGLFGTTNITTSGDDTVSFLGLGTLNIAGTVATPITVNISQLAGVGLLDTINISNATVTMQGLAGGGALAAFNIGTNGTLKLNSTVGLSVGSTINFTGQNSVLAFGPGLDLSVLSGINGFAPGSTIDVSQMATGYTYADAAGNNTGGVITLTNAAGNVVGTVPLATGEYTTGSFVIRPDGTGGTLIQFGANVASVVATPATADDKAGQTITLAVNTTSAVTVANGTPTLTLNDGGTATYVAALSTPTNLVFSYTVANGENTPDLAITAANLNGATITASTGVPLDLTAAVVNPAGTLQIDTIAPTVTGLTAAPGTADLGAGSTITFNLASSEAVTVAGGTPTLTLNDGGLATYNAAASTATNLVFSYTVATGENTADLAVTAANLNGATIADGAGNAADLTADVGNPAGTLQIDTIAPTITAVAATPATGDLTAGATVSFTLTPSEAVTIAGGTPTLTLNDGGVATYNAAASTPTSLVFTTTIAAGQNTPDLAVTAANLNGATVKDGAGNPANLTGAVGNPAGVLQIDTIVPTVTAVTTNPGSGMIGVGQTIAITVATTKPVTVAGGTPTLTLSDGGTATFDPGSSTPTNLVFTTTIAAGQNTPDLAVTGTSLNGATIADGAGNPADLSGAIANPPGVLQVNTTAPTLALALTPGTADLGVGGIVTFTATSSAPLTLTGGTPTLTLNDGGIATYNAAASTPTSLMFTYTVAAGENTPDLAVTAANLNGATIADGAGNLPDLSTLVGNPPGILQVDTLAPTIASLTATPTTGDLGAGATVSFTLTSTEAVTVVGGTPTLTLNDGGIATYNAAASTPTSLVFTTTIAAGQNTPDLAVTAANLNGATIADGAGNAANLLGAVGNPAGTLQVDTLAPTITSLVATPGTGDLGAGATVSFTLTPSEAVVVAGGTPTLSLSDGGIATYNAAASTPTSLVFTTTIAAGQNTPDLAVTAANLNGATIADGAGNPANLLGAVGNPAGTLQVDTIAPTITSLVATPGAGDLGAGATVSFTLTPSEAVVVAGGTPTLTLNDGGIATYNAAASTPSSLVFTYTVAAGENTPDLAVTAANLNGATVADGAGNLVNLAGAVGNPAGILQVDTIAPTVTGVTTNPGSGPVGLGQVVAITVATTEPVTVAGGTPTLTLNNGGTATYDPTLSTPGALVFDYTVAAGQNVPDLTVTAVNPNGAIIADGAGNPANLTGAIGNPPGVLQVNTATPVLTLTVTPATADLGVGGVVTFTATSSAPLTLSGGTPTLTLNDGGTATYNAGASTPSSLVFTYTVAAGENTPDLAVTSANLNGATVADSAGNAPNVATLVGNPAGILQVDTIAPTVTGVTTNPGSGPVGLGQVVAITVATTEPVTVAGGTPTLTLNNGGTATYDPTLSTPGALVFDYTVAAGQNVPDLTVTAVNPNGATIADGAGNPANLTGAIGNPPGVLQVNTATPVLTLTVTPATADLGVGGVVTFTATSSAPLTLSGGTPTLTLNDGGTATYNAGASTPSSLVFTYTVAAGENTPDLAVTAANLNGATIADGAGNAPNVATLVGNPAGILQVDTLAPTITSLVATPGTGDLGAGAIVSFTLTPSEAVIVAGGTPTLSLSDGGIATYNAAASTPTSLVFTTTIAAGQNTSDLAVTAANLNGATITDGAGNPANLAGAVGNPAGILQVDTIAPTITSLVATPGTGDLGAGATVSFTLTPSEAVTVAGGTPTLTLNDGGVATYNAAASTPTSLVFTTTIAAGQNAPDLAVTAANLNGATITDGAGNPANLLGAVGNPAGILQVDTIAPTVAGVTTNPGSGAIGAGQTVAITVTTTEPVTVAGGTPTLTLSDGGTATYNPGASTPTTLVFTTTVTAGQSTPDLAVTGVNLNGATITDGAGNTTSLAGAVGNPPGVLAVGGTPTTGIHPFTTLIASNNDPTASVTVTVVLNPIVAGTFSNLGTGRLAADGNTYSVTGSAAQVNAALAGVLLTPAPGAAAPAGYLASIVDSNGGVTSRLTDIGTTASNLIVSSAGDVLLAGLGADTLRAGNSGNTLYGGPGNDVLLGNALGSTLAGGSGSSVLISGGGTTRLVGAGAADTIAGVLGDVTIVTATGGRSLVATGAGVSIVNSQGSDTIIGGNGAEIVATARASLVGLGAGPAVVLAGTGTTVIGGAGPDTIGVSGTGALFFAGSGNSIFIGGSGSSTMVGGAGSQVAFGGAGGGLFKTGTGGNSTVIGGQQATTMLGTASGDQLYAVGSAGTVLVAGAGNETLSSAFSSGNDTLYAGSGNTAIALGSGSDLVEAGSGSSTVYGSSGTATYGFANGQGGQTSILNFRVGTDHLVLQGFGSTETQKALSSASVSAATGSQPASTTFTLSDNTRITVYNLGAADPNVFR